MRISKKAWSRYTKTLNKLDTRAASEFQAYYESLTAQDLPDAEFRRRLITRANALATKYGEAASAAACEMYDAIAAAQRASVPASLPAATSSYSETAKAVNGALKHSRKAEVIGSVAGRLVKQAGADTMLHNARRDHAEWAWIPAGGETCAFCLTLASQGWLPASKAQLDGDHAEHIHANCECTFAIRFGPDLDVSGYEPEKYKEMYDNASDGGWKDKVNAMRREMYEENKAEINAQKREAYRIRTETQE